MTSGKHEFDQNGTSLAPTGADPLLLPGSSCRWTGDMVGIVGLAIADLSELGVRVSASSVISAA